MSKLDSKRETFTGWFSSTASAWRTWADAHRRLITVREREMCDMEILLDECENLRGNVSECSSDSVCYRSFFFSLVFYLSLCFCLSDCLSLHCISFFLMPFWLFCLTHTSWFIISFSSILFQSHSSLKYFKNAHLWPFIFILDTIFSEN